MSTAARCSSIIVNGLTAALPVSCALIEDPEILTKLYSTNRQNAIYAGEEIAGITITVCDLEFWEALKKGTRIVTCVVKMESALDADGTALSEGDVVTGTLTGGYVSEAVSMESSTDGLPIEYSITMMLCLGSTGTPATFVTS